jgi:hypothetical protein
VVRKLVASGKELLFVYEAGPCGFAIYRWLKNQTVMPDYERRAAVAGDVGAWLILYLLLWRLVEGWLDSSKRFGRSLRIEIGFTLYRRQLTAAVPANLRF